jgi:hypothetical protein
MAHAQAATADQLFNDGLALMSANKLAQACEAFEQSNRIDPRAGTLIRLGECRERARQVASAWSAYTDALARAKDPHKRDVAERRIANLEPRLSYLTVSVSEDNPGDGLEITWNGKPFNRTAWNRALPVDGGDYVVVARAPGRRDWQTTATVAVEGARINIPIPRLAELPAPVARPAPPAASPALQLTAVEPRDPESDRVFTSARKASVVMLSAGAVGAATAVVLGMRAADKEDQALRACPMPGAPCRQAAQANALIRSNHSLALEANIALGVAAAAAVGAGILWFLGAPDPVNARVGIVPVVSQGMQAVVITRRF